MALNITQALSHNLEKLGGQSITGAVVGMDGAMVEVEVDIAPGGMPNFLVVGLPDAAVQEASERVRAAIPQRRSRSTGLCHLSNDISTT